MACNCMCILGREGEHGGAFCKYPRPHGVDGHGFGYTVSARFARLPEMLTEGPYTFSVFLTEASCHAKVFATRMQIRYGMYGVSGYLVPG